MLLPASPLPLVAARPVRLDVGGGPLVVELGAHVFRVLGIDGRPRRTIAAPFAEGVARHGLIEDEPGVVGLALVSALHDDAARGGGRPPHLVVRSSLAEAVNEEWFLGALRHVHGLPARRLREDEEIALETLGAAAVAPPRVAVLVLDVGRRSIDLGLALAGQCLATWRFSGGTRRAREEGLAATLAAPLRRVESIARAVRPALATAGGLARALGAPAATLDRAALGAVRPTDPDEAAAAAILARALEVLG